MNFFLVDFENVKTNGLEEISDIQENDAMIIFYSEQCKSITLDTVSHITKLKLKLSTYKVKTGTKNALDFQLASHLGYLIARGSSDAAYHIVSNDKGYDCLCQYWQEAGVNVDRISFKDNNSEKTTEIKKKTKSKVAADNLATIEEIKKYLSNEDMPEEVLLIFNQYKTKQAICNGISKKCKDSKRTSNIYKKLKPLLKEKKKS